MPTTKNKTDLLNSFQLLSTYLKGFENGEQLLYLPMAVELRKLLCENNPSPLVTRVIPDFKLYKLHSATLFDGTPSLLKGLEHFMPGKLEVGDNNVTILRLSLSRTKELMEVREWTDQIFFKEKITIRGLIKSVADKEGAHSDANDNATLEYSKNWLYKDVSSRILGIYAIARLVYDVFENEYKTAVINAGNQR